MNNSSHIAVFAFPFSSHAATLLAVVRRLVASAPGVRISFFSTSKSNALMFSGHKTDDEFDNIKAYSVWDGMPEGDVVVENVHEAVGIFLKATPDNFKKGIQEAEADRGVKISCLLTDAFLWFAGEMAEEMGVPWVPLWIAGACSLSIHVYTDLIRNTLRNTGTIEDSVRTLDIIPGMSAIHVDDLPEGVLFGNLESPVSLLLHTMGLKLLGATAILVNSFEELDSTITNDLKSKLPKVLCIGPSILSVPPPSSSDDSGCLLWLDKHKAASVAYISFGTILTPPPDELVALAGALETSGIPFLWALPDNARHHLPVEFLGRTSKMGKIVSWAPQLQVLAHTSVGVSVTHGGWNSVLESISFGVPMICRPFFADNMLNSRMVEDVWQIGVIIEGGIFTKSGVMKALDLVLVNQKGEELRKNMGVLKELARKAVGSDGSSMENFKTLKDIVISCPGPCV